MAAGKHGLLGPPVALFNGTTGIEYKDVTDGLSNTIMAF